VMTCTILDRRLSFREIDVRHDYCVMGLEMGVDLIVRTGPCSTQDGVGVQPAVTSRAFKSRGLSWGRVQKLERSYSFVDGN
jgi:hypothetical protein